MNYSVFLTEESKYIQKVFSTMISPYIFDFSLKLVFYLRFIDFFLKKYNVSSFDFNKYM
jgi:hypothetical protein